MTVISRNAFRLRAEQADVKQVRGIDLILLARVSLVAEPLLWDMEISFSE